MAYGFAIIEAVWIKSKNTQVKTYIPDFFKTAGKKVLFSIILVVKTKLILLLYQVFWFLLVYKIPTYKINKMYQFNMILIGEITDHRLLERIKKKNILNMYIKTQNWLKIKEGHQIFQPISVHC